MSSIIADMQIFNGETKTKFQPYWDAIVAVLEEQNGVGAHRRGHAALDVQTTTDVQYAQGITFIPQLQCTAMKHLIEEKKMQEEVDFKVPSISWINLQLTPNNPFKETTVRYTESIPFQLRLQSCGVCNFSHPAAHYVSAMEKAWMHVLLHLYSLFEEHANSDSDDFISYLQLLEALRIFGCGGKTFAPVGRTTLILVTANQSARALVSSASGHSPQAADHDCYSKAETVAIIHSMNRDADSSSLLYSVGVDGNGH
eukprot:14045000-Ditylum_brightwellii.AAC.1